MGNDDSRPLPAATESAVVNDPSTHTTHKGLVRPRFNLTLTATLKFVDWSHACLWVINTNRPMIRDYIIVS
jgi:hypothetical protein